MINRIVVFNDANFGDTANANDQAAQAVAKRVAFFRVKQCEGFVFGEFSENQIGERLLALFAKYSGAWKWRLGVYGQLLEGLLLDLLLVAAEHPIEGNGDGGIWRDGEQPFDHVAMGLEAVLVFAGGVVELPDPGLGAHEKARFSFAWWQLGWFEVLEVPACAALLVSGLTFADAREGGTEGVKARLGTYGAVPVGVVPGNPDGKMR